jgi:hypothetical protein
MANLFLGNAYNVLGLDTSASQKEINKRAKDIINLLRIDEHSEYETDLDFAKVKREEGSVKEAVQRLSSPTKRIQEYFFWFDVENDNDEKALKLLQANDIDGAVSLWEAEADKETANGFVAKKNLAVVSSLLLIDKGQKKYLTQSIGYWKDLVLSDKFWSHFEKLYALNDEIGTSKSALTDFSEKVTDELSDFYTDVSQKHNDNSFYSLFSQVFAVKGQKMQRDVLSPIYEAIHDASEKLENLNISEDNIISDDEIATLKSLTRVLQTNFDKLKELGLYGDSASKTMRDKAAEALRTVALDLYNNLSESAKPVALLNIASKIAGTPATLNKINKDVEQLRQNRSNERIIKPINDLLSEEKYDDALLMIESRLKENKNDKDLVEYLTTRMKWCVTGLAAEGYKDMMAKFNAGKFAQAESGFLGLKEFILNYIHYFDYNKESLDDVLAKIESMTNDANSLNLDSIQKYRNGILEGASETFKDQFEDTLLVFLIDSSIYANLSHHLPAIKRKKTIRKWVWYIVIGIIILIWIAASGDDSSTSGSSTGSSSPSSSSSSSSAYTTCAAEYDSLKSQLDSVESQMNGYKANDDADNFNALVPRQNSLVQQVNSKATECNGLR